MIRAALGTVCMALALVVAQAAHADYDAGQRAWEAGQVDEALAQWRAAAESGDRRAMLALGRLNVQGLGVLQDYVQAHVWFNLAASRGVAAALEEREAVAAKMTPEQVARAQQLAAAWRPAAGQTAAASGAADAPAGGGTATATADRPPPRAIRETQSLLAALGYRPGPADGIWGARTGRAYRSFLRDAGLPAGEMVTPSGLRALREIAARQGAVAEPAHAATAGGSAQPSPEPDAARRPPAPDALHRAAQAGDAGALKAALSAGAEANARDAQGWTALMHAANEGDALLIEPLLSAGANPDLRASDGATALFIAALHGYSEVVAKLLRAGADASIAGPKDRTPLDMARSLNHSRVLALPEVVALEQAQARREREETERREREEEKLRAEEESGAFERAKVQDSAPAYAAYLSAWCPQGKHCAAARARVDGLLREGIVGRTFDGMNSRSESQSFQFLPSGEVVAQYGRGNFFSGCTRRGTWHVEDGSVVINSRCKGHSFSVAHAVLDGDVLVGSEITTLDNWLYRGQEFQFEWRLTERTAAEIEAEKKATTRKHTFQPGGK